MDATEYSLLEDPLHPTPPSGVAAPAVAEPGKPLPVLQDMLVDDPALRAFGQAQVWGARTGGSAAGGSPWVSPDQAWPRAGSGRTLALIDPQGRPSSVLMSALQGLGARTPQRLLLRQSAGLQPLATLTRADWPRPGQAMLHVLAIQASIDRLEATDAAHALAGSAELTVVLVDQLREADLSRLCVSLRAAMLGDAWRCPQLLFMLPTQRHSAAAMLKAIGWPPGVRVGTVQADLPAGGWLAADAGAAARTWAPLLTAWHSAAPLWAGSRPAGGDGVWGRLPQAAPASANDSRPALLDAVAPLPGHRYPQQSAAPQAEAPDRTQGTGLPRSTHAGVNALRPTGPGERRSTAEPDWRRLLEAVHQTEGLLQCAIVDLATGDLLCTDQRADSGGATARRMPSLATLAEALMSARRAHGAVAGEPEEADEMLITAAGRQALLRRLPVGDQRGFLALLDRSQANLALLRFRLADAGRLLAG